MHRIRSGPAGEKLGFWSQILSQSLDLVEKEVHVCLGDKRREHNQSEKVDPVSQRLIAHHHRALFRHAFLDDRSNL